MSKADRIRQMSVEFEGAALDARYLAFFKLFNTRLFFEAHEVLEDLWLERKGENYAFYKGLIQFAGAFVHLQKRRIQPAAALLRLAIRNLRTYPALHEQLDVPATLALMEMWLGRVEQATLPADPLEKDQPPQLVLAGEW